MMLPTALSSRLPRFVQRLLRIGPRHGIARGLAVYGGPGTRNGAIGAATAVLQPDALTRWLADRNEPRGNTRDALAAIERRLDEAQNDEELGHMLGSEIALLLGQVLIANVDGARWTVWPNGHPVIRIGHTDLDVTEISDAYLHRHGNPPTTIVDKYQTHSR